MADVKLSPHFFLSEFTFSQTAARMGIDNTPDAASLANLERLAGVMEVVRRVLGDKPIIISSGYRNEATNSACGGSSTSAHMYGLAVDFSVPEYGTPEEVAKKLDTNLEQLHVDQLILEFCPGGWIHLAIAAAGEEARCQKLVINENGTNAVESFA
jgi:zinc D-Ala-D-Ala carboxypeptidase